MAAAAALCTALLAIPLRVSAQEERKTTLRGNDEIVTETLSVGDFTELHTRGMFNVTFVQSGPGEKARAERPLPTSFPSSQPRPRTVC